MVDLAKRQPQPPGHTCQRHVMIVLALYISQCTLLIAQSKNYWFSKCHNSHSLLHVFFQGLTILSVLYVSHRHTLFRVIAGVAILVLIAWFWNEVSRILKLFLNVYVWAATDGSPRLIGKWTELEAGTKNIQKMLFILLGECNMNAINTNIAATAII